ncbi:acyltransferase family protein [Bradyrhizobium elkanii]|uniref:acyltransferase family protein n=1 Tax=Bradyrhizobium elkanii TaxID=29448 RepID=UPI001AE11F14|nr:acyltransferase [Bradyrhizobium elkanii]MBP2427618.1 peptidoglycan/LPS O-acetylase OafA/YrhL [Bradyrhizobium elkanii]WLA94688.1 acyltransferase [Bradyrhizobium elkanii]
MRPELRALTGIRGLAATTVALAHFRLPLPFGLRSIFQWEDAAVVLFFCLSGFTLAYVYGRDRFRFSSYIVARIGRVYPLYFLTLVGLGAAYVVPLIINPETYPVSRAISDFVLQALMLNAWPVIGYGDHWNFPAWSISVEWFCYLLVFPLLLHLPKPPRSDNARLLALVVLSALCYSLLLGVLDERIMGPTSYVAAHKLSYWAPVLEGILAFTAGWIAFVIHEDRDDIHFLCRQYSSLIWICIAVILILRYFMLINSQMMLFLFPFVVLAATDATSATSRILGSRPLHFLGLISYSIYLMHFPVMLAFLLVLGEPGAWSGWVYATLVIATFLVSVVTYFAIERPARDAIRGLYTQRHMPGLVAVRRDASVKRK